MESKGTDTRQVQPDARLHLRQHVHPHHQLHLFISSFHLLALSVEWQHRRWTWLNMKHQKTAERTTRIDGLLQPVIGM